MSPLVVQDDGVTKHIMRTWPDGGAHVVYYTKGISMQLVKEEIYFENGNLDYSGNYYRGKEHGEWIYYWENGNVKSKEIYEKGLEEGEMFDFDKTGKAVKKYTYVKGRLIEEVPLKP
jgi:antitoxin component YwqK of YwqJK toxin-antitoxin module